MALEQLSASTNRYIVPVMTDNVFKATPAMVMLVRKTQLVDGGASFAQPIRIGRNPAGSSYSGADPIPTFFDNANNIGAEWNWAQYGRGIGVTGLDELRNRGPRGALNNIAMSVESIEMELREDMGTYLYGDGTANGNKAFVGFGAAIDDGTNVVTYGSVSRTTYPNWKANFSGNGGVGRPLTLSLLNTNYENCVKDNDAPDVILFTHGLYVKYLSLIQGGVRFGEKHAASMGFQSLLYRNRPMIVDEMISTAGGLHSLYFINLKYVKLFTSMGRNFAFSPFQRIPMTDSAAALVLWAGQIVVNACRMMGRVADIDLT